MIHVIFDVRFVLAICSMIGAACSASASLATQSPPTVKPRIEIAGFTVIGLSNHVDNTASHPVQARQGAGIRLGTTYRGLGLGIELEGAQSEAQIQHIFGDVSHEISAGGYALIRRFGNYARQRRWGVTAMAGAGVTWMAFADGGMFDVILIDSGVVPYLQAQVRVSREKNYGRYLLTAGAGLLFKTHIGQVQVEGGSDSTTRMGGQSLSLVTGIGVSF